MSRNVEQDPPPGEPLGASWARVDPDACIGSGVCLATAPLHFEPAGNTGSRARSDAPAADGSARDAAVLCPVEAIGFVRSRPPSTPLPAPQPDP
ncbi:ferredoxin [Streptomyces sp. NBC_01387]|uniref:ferredoxin n=1 Tax=unclassified Streptomyces TaxID=2593676 RepID=UPI0020256284|nr:ferredoxin [Streptomyces sp. A 4/2]